MIPEVTRPDLGMDHFSSKINFPGLFSWVLNQYLFLSSLQTTPHSFWKQYCWDIPKKSYGLIRQAYWALLMVNFIPDKFQNMYYHYVKMARKGVPQNWPLNLQGQEQMEALGQYPTDTHAFICQLVEDRWVVRRTGLFPRWNMDWTSE